MVAITFSDARRRLAEVADLAQAFPVFITRAGGETLVLMNARELASISETAHLLSTEANRSSLVRALNQIEKGQTVRVDIDDL